MYVSLAIVLDFLDIRPICLDRGIVQIMLRDPGSAGIESIRNLQRRGLVVSSFSEDSRSMTVCEEGCTDGVAIEILEHIVYFS